MVDELASRMVVETFQPRVNFQPRAQTTDFGVFRLKPETFESWRG
jgi:hypothetical protein